MKLLFLNIFLVLAVAVSVAGDIFAKKWVLNKGSVFFVTAMVFYTVASVLWMLWLPYVRLSVAVTWWQSFAVVLTILTAIFYFHERVTPLEIFAIVLVVSGVVILNFKHG